mmetsp:Transcript_5988/g.8477  ORF Transcript_5988/g.8477 Transcript_5988/m.8477 type:complete len:225 (-) Transcript_5988:278-952(-)
MKEEQKEEEFVMLQKEREEASMASKEEQQELKKEESHNEKDLKETMYQVLIIVWKKIEKNIPLIFIFFVGLGLGFSLRFFFGPKSMAPPPKKSYKFTLIPFQHITTKTLYPYHHIIPFDPFEQLFQTPFLNLHSIHNQKKLRQAHPNSYHQLYYYYLPFSSDQLQEKKKSDTPPSSSNNNDIRREHLRKKSITELRDYLKKHGAVCHHCLEKDDLVDRIMTLGD